MVFSVYMVPMLYIVETDTFLSAVSFTARFSSSARFPFHGNKLLTSSEVNSSDTVRTNDLFSHFRRHPTIALTYTYDTFKHQLRLGTQAKFRHPFYTKLNRHTEQNSIVTDI